jgi:hypothetical protein
MRIITMGSLCKQKAATLKVAAFQQCYRYNIIKEIAVHGFLFR